MGSARLYAPEVVCEVGPEKEAVTAFLACVDRARLLAGSTVLLAAGSIDVAVT